MKLICVKTADNKIVADKATLASKFLERGRGLLFSKPLTEGAGLWITPCNSVHTFFMTYSIDVIFLDKNLKIVNIMASMAPGHVSPIVKSAHSVLELPAGTAEKTSLAVGEQLVMEA